MKRPSSSAFLAALILAGCISGGAFAQNLLDPAPLGAPNDTRLRATPPAAARTSNDPPGRYAPLREGNKDTGCMITLEASRKAQLAPACRDQGLVVFDPINWQMDRGRLGLTARKGHKAWFDRQSDGTWLRDPKEGKTLILRVI
ncbi:MAG: hypothetical protein RIQ68_484 [Pseudomonadota bacterium]|jgi:hypothetical protein